MTDRTDTDTLPPPDVWFSPAPAGGPQRTWHPDTVARLLAERDERIARLTEALQRTQRLPLTDEQIDAHNYPSWMENATLAFRRGVRFAERAHGITLADTEKDPT